MFFCLSCTIKVIILPPICAFTTLTFSHFFLLNASIVVINVKFKFTHSKRWQMVSVIEIFQSMSLYSCYFLCPSFNDASTMCEKFPFPTKACLPLTEFENVGNICFWEPDFMLLKNKQTFSLKQPKAMQACRRKKRVYFPFYILFSKFLKSSNFILPYSNFSHKTSISHTDCSH